MKRIGLLRLLPILMFVPASLWSQLPNTQCYPEATLCTLFPATCLPLIVSLVPLQNLPTTDVGYSRGGRCDVGRTDGKACGAYLGIGVCNESSGGPDNCGHSGPGMGACEYGVEDGGLEASVALAPRPETLLEVAAIERRLDAIGRSGLPPAIHDYWQALAAVDSIHLRAQLEIWIAPEETEMGRDLLGTGSFEYWESGDRFHAIASVPPALGLSQVGEMAFDGLSYQLFMPVGGVLAVNGSNQRMWPLPVRNPLFLPLKMLDPNSDECPACALRVVDLTGTPPREKLTKGAGPIEIVIPKANLGDVEVGAYRIAEENGPRGGRRTFEARSIKGEVSRRIEMTFFNPVQGAPDLIFPWTIVEERFAQDGKLLQRITYRIETIRANETMPDFIFRLDPPGVQRLWDEQHHMFIF